jgi:heme-degrading monooxygenase HmoA
MSVIVTTRIPGLPGEAYDETASHLAEPLRGADGFIAHAASADIDGVVVTELWETEGDWSRFFEAHVKPNLPGTLPAPTVVEMRNTILR